MKKILDIIIFTLLFLLLFSYFSGENTQAPLTGLELSTSHTKYAIPASIITTLTNNTSETLAFASCEAMSLR